MRKGNLITLGFVIILLLFLGLVFFGSGEKKQTEYEIGERSQTREGIYVGESPPDFMLKDLRGEDIKLRSYRGKVALLNFWATWCPPCRKEIPSMVKLYERYKSKGLEILGVNLDKMDKSGVEKFILEYHINFPVLLDPAGRVAIQYGITGLPTTFTLGRKGIILERITGGIDWTAEENIKKIEIFLAEP